MLIIMINDRQAFAAAFTVKAVWGGLFVFLSLELSFCLGFDRA